MARSEMATASTSNTPPKKPSFLRRLSQSTASTSKQPVIASAANGTRSVSSPLRSPQKEEVIAGPSYEFLSKGLPHTSTSTSPRRFNATQSKFPYVKQTNIIAPPMPTALVRTPTDTDPSPSRERNPIRPVIASPIMSPVGGVADSPYGFQHGPLRPSLASQADIPPSRRRVSSRTSSSRTDHSTVHVISSSRPPPKTPPLPRSTSSNVSRFADADVRGLPPGALAPAGLPKTTRPSLVPAEKSTPVRTTSRSANPAEGLTEASAYAKAITSSSRPARTAPDSSRRVSRPLPRPPSMTSPIRSTDTSVDGRGEASPKSTGLASQSQSFAVVFPKSPTLPPLVDPRQSPADQWGATGASKARPRPSRAKPSLALILSRPKIQAALLPWLPINSFLSLSGSSTLIRKQLSGELVGRWVMNEWGLSVERERGRSWPNITVWEGFLEALLHDPASYSTYSTEWQQLLSHLSLSHTLIVLHLRTLPPSAFPLPPPIPFEDEILPLSGSLGNLALRPQSRVGSTVGSDMGSPIKMPRQERLVEIIMPEPLAAQPQVDVLPPCRRDSVSSFSASMGRKRSSTVTSDSTSKAEVIVSGKGIMPPVSYPTAKRYGFKRHGETTRSRTSSDSGRPASIFSVSSSPSFAYPARSFVERGVPSVLAARHRASVASSDGGSRFSDQGSPVTGKSPFQRVVEPAFERPVPFALGRAPILRVFVPLSERVRRWPSSEGAAVAVRELDKCGALKKLRLGDLVVNTALKRPTSTEHVLIFVPFMKHLLVPLDYTHSASGHLPSYLDGFSVPPSYYHHFLPTPQIIFLDLRPFARRALESIRLAYDRRDVTVASGAKLSAKRYLHVAGFEIKEGDNVSPDWQGMVSLEAEGTAEGRRDLEACLGNGDPLRAKMEPWEVLRDKSMAGSIWLKLVR